MVHILKTMKTTKTTSDTTMMKALHLETLETQALSERLQSATISQQRWAGWNLGVKVNCCHFHISSYWDRICSQPMNPQGRITQIFVAMGVAASKSACGAGLWVDLRNHIWVKKSCVIPTSWTEKYLVPKANQAELHHAVKLKLIIIMLAGFQGCL